MNKQQAAEALAAVNKTTLHAQTNKHQVLLSTTELGTVMLALQSVIEAGDESELTYVSGSELFQALGAPKEEADKQDRELNSILRRGSLGVVPQPLSGQTEPIDAVSLGCISVDADGTKKLDVKKLLSTPEGVKRLMRLRAATDHFADPGKPIMYTDGEMSREIEERKPDVMGAVEYFQRWLDFVDAPEPPPPYFKAIFNSPEEIQHVRTVVAALRSPGMVNDTGLKDRAGKPILYGQVVHWSDGGDDLPMEARITTRWDRIAVVEKNGIIPFFRVIDSPHEKTKREGHSFNYGNFIYKDTERYLTIVAESETDYHRKFTSAGECMVWVEAMIAARPKQEEGV